MSPCEACKKRLERFESNIKNDSFEKCAFYERGYSFYPNVYSILECKICQENQVAQTLVTFFNILFRYKHELEFYNIFLQDYSMEGRKLLGCDEGRQKEIQKRYIVSKIFLIFIKRFHLEEELAKMEIPEEDKNPELDYVENRLILKDMNDNFFNIQEDEKEAKIINFLRVIVY